MVKRIWQAWRRDEGGWASPEWALVITLLVLGAITGVFQSKQARLAPQEPTVAYTR
jgi:hypothetical protein